MKAYRGKRIVIIGAARQGTALARYMLGQGALVTLNDRQTAEQLQPVIDSFAGQPLKWVLGEHPLTLLDNADMLFISGGVPNNLSIVRSALERGIPVSNDSQVFMENVKAPVVGITGSAGKTTTTALFGRIAEAEVRAPSKAWVGGNIGRPLVEYVDVINENDLVVQELSSFQLQFMNISPQVAAILNITPNHLDRHVDMAEYIHAKSRIIAFQHPGDTAVLNHEDREAWNLRGKVRGRLISFGLEPVSGQHTQVFVQQGHVVVSAADPASSVPDVTPLLDTRLVQLRGAHNLRNILAACALAYALDFDPASIAAGVQGFTGVKHREQLVRVVDGVSWINDSIATAPERTLAAIKAFDEPILLLLGGRDKNLPWQELAAEIHHRVRQVILFGEAAGKIAAAIGEPAGTEKLKSVVMTSSLLEALEVAHHSASAGDVVLLSPGCTSYDAFKDFEERGDTFIDWVNAL
jgi:UDP-N-acetylmuramoylalanine--D-glutamate ligase